jgi:hypothetical protein
MSMLDLLATNRPIAQLGPNLRTKLPFQNRETRLVGRVWNYNSRAKIGDGFFKSCEFAPSFARGAAVYLTDKIFQSK